MKVVYSRDQYLDELFELIDVDSIGAEIGVLFGDFAMQLYQKLTPIELILVDPYNTGNIKYNGMDLMTSYSTESNYQNVRKRFENLHIVEIDRRYSYNAVYSYPNNYFDWIYHDASHLYEDLKRDLFDWLRVLKPSGLMCGHDYGGIFEGVKQAVDEFMIEHNFEMIILNENGGDFALRRK